MNNIYIRRRREGNCKGGEQRAHCCKRQKTREKSKKIKVEESEEIYSVCDSGSAIYMALCTVCTAAEVSPT
jgi:hypothetical protein